MDRREFAALLAVPIIRVANPCGGDRRRYLPSPERTPMMKKLTPVLPVDAIEPVLPFWERLGFARTAEVPEGDRLGFVILAKDQVEVMYQTFESMMNDVASVAEATPRGGTLLFIEVEDLDGVIAMLGDIEPLIPRRTTFYGADEYILREPGGHIVTFAEMPDAGAA